MARPPLLLLAVGNPSRGDDALGWHLAERARERWADPIATGALEVLTDFQLQVEHALDLEGREHVVLADASCAAPPPYTLGSPAPEAATAFSHALSPAGLLGVLDTLGKPRPPRVEVLAIRGESFELGEPLTAAAAAHLEQALQALDPLLGVPPPAGLRLTVTGTVQGVGFRPFVARTARALGLRGSVRNTAEGVVIELWGPPSACEALRVALQSAPPPGAWVRGVRRAPLHGAPPAGFEIAPSPPGAGRLSIPPDLALCPACRAELFTPGDRHAGYAFTSCTACGPRLSITTGLPYDRANTTLAAFPLCPECVAEYEDPEDRRHHAQATACPRCGPRLGLLGPDGAPLEGPPLEGAAAVLRAGGVVALQGLGGFHLACDATSSAAVARLRARKRRDAKPFAVMVATVEDAAALAVLTPEARALLSSPAGPIVLADAQPGGPLAPEVAGEGRRVGVLCPTTPLHTLLLDRVSPLVMTSGNLSGEPLARTPEEALAALGAVADAFLVHDRPIARRVEDSVVSCDPRLPPRVLRRARGYAPRPIRLPLAAPEPVLAVGGQLKSTAAVVIGDECWLTPHLGDLHSHAAEQAWVEEVEGFERLLGVRCELLVHDAHPDYSSTRYAERRTPRRLAVQHHHAHTLAVLAERATLEPVLAIVLDGTGWGPDHTAWGGELLRVDGLRFTRPTALRPIPLPGGERAIHEVWRAAYGALYDAFGPETPALVARLPTFAGPRGPALAAVHEALERGVGVVRARGVGRLFDAAAALVLGRGGSRYEGELPARLEDLAAPGARPYPFQLPTAVGTGHSLTPAQELDLRPTWRALVDELLRHTPPAVIASRLHATLVAATLACVETHQLAAGVRRVVLCGGALQNRLLERAFRDALGDVLLDSVEVPVNDGGLALGQALAGALHLHQNGARGCALVCPDRSSP